MHLEKGINSVTQGLSEEKTFWVILGTLSPSETISLLQ